MPDPINLRHARKAKARADHQKIGAQNRVAFGQSKEAKSLAKATNNAVQRHLDNARLEKDQKS